MTPDRDQSAQFQHLQVRPVPELSDYLIRAVVNQIVAMPVVFVQQGARA